MKELLARTVSRNSAMFDNTEAARGEKPVPSKTKYHIKDFPLRKFLNGERFYLSSRHKAELNFEVIYKVGLWPTNGNLQEPVKSHCAIGRSGRSSRLGGEYKCISPWTLKEK
jgi:hypothetical protein